MQNFYNLLYREEEREMIPYCDFAGIGIIPWSPVARGVLARPWGAAQKTLRGESDRSIKSLIWSQETEIDKVITDRVEEIARKHGVPMAQVAAAWTMKKGCCPIMGLNTKKRIDEAVRTACWDLSDEDGMYLEEAYRPKSVVGH
jgi:aryl-alcohol dehydrogenase-like predicted oxidoreductase